MKVKGWKCFDKDLKCRGFQFMIGGTYTHDGEVEMCKSGFHFHEYLGDIMGYYNSDSRICQVEAWGVLSGYNKSVCRKIKIFRECENKELNIGGNNTGRLNSGGRNSGDRNSGDRNSGDRNSGYRNSGYSNSGGRNSGDSNSGYSNSGDSNSGDRNSGDRNSGGRNSGYSNSGDRNSGYRNSGGRNSGDWNSGNRHSGFFNSIQDPDILVFNKPCKFNKWSKAQVPYWLNFNITKWVNFDNMTDDEKEIPNCEIMGGYLKSLNYKEEAKRSYDEASESDKGLTVKLPNFDHDVFEEIFGFRLDLDKEQK